MERRSRGRDYAVARERKVLVTTDKQIAANRRNALRSTGPKTSEGKAAVRHNALRHGLLSRDIFIDTGEGREDAQEYAALLEELRDALQPEGRLELILMEKIAVAYWRLCRAARAEVGVLRRAFNGLGRPRREAQEEALRCDLEELDRDVESFRSAALLKDVGPFGGPTAVDLQRESREETHRRLRKHLPGVRHLVETLDRAIGEADGGELTAATVCQLEREFCRSGTTLIERIDDVLSDDEWDNEMDEVPDDDESDDAIVIADADRKAVLQLLNTEREALWSVRDELEQYQDEAIEAARAASALPNDADFQRIQRYESVYERQFYQAMNQLERLQRRRLGEISAPPISVNFTHED
jgi:hypothetical protein